MLNWPAVDAVVVTLNVNALPVLPAVVEVGVTAIVSGCFVANTVAAATSATSAARPRSAALHHRRPLPAVFGGSGTLTRRKTALMLALLPLVHADRDRRGQRQKSPTER